MEITTDGTTIDTHDQFLRNSSPSAVPADVATNVDTGLPPNAASYYSQFTQHVPVQITFALAYSLIFFAGLAGNALVCYVVVTRPNMRTVTNIFILNLALADIFLCFLAVPITPLYSFLGGWYFGETLCYIFPMSQGISVYTSTYTLASIAIDRYIVVLYPVSFKKLTPGGSVGIILFIWLASTAVTLPYGLYMKYEKHEDISICKEGWPEPADPSQPHEWYRKVFGIVTAILQFGVPCVIITFSYLRISHALKRQAQIKEIQMGQRTKESDRVRNQHINRMIAAVVSVFAICWLPLTTINLANDLVSNLGHWYYYELLFFTFHCFAMSSTCYNPLLYAWLNENFRKEFRTVLSNVRCWPIETRCLYCFRSGRSRLGTKSDGDFTAADCYGSAGSKNALRNTSQRASDKRRPNNNHHLRSNNALARVASAASKDDIPLREIGVHDGNNIPADGQNLNQDKIPATGTSSGTDPSSTLGELVTFPRHRQQQLAYCNDTATGVVSVVNCVGVENRQLEASLMAAKRRTTFNRQRSMQNNRRKDQQESPASVDSGGSPPDGGGRAPFGPVPSVDDFTTSTTVMSRRSTGSDAEDASATMVRSVKVQIISNEQSTKRQASLIVSDL